MKKVIIIAYILLALTAGYNTEKTVPATVYNYNPVYQTGTLIDTEGELWAFEDVELHPDACYSITYKGYFDLVEVTENEDTVIYKAE